MTPKNKAIELYNLFYLTFQVDPEKIRIKMAKRAAKITVKEIEKFSEKYMDNGYWKDTINEIDKL